MVTEVASVYPLKRTCVRQKEGGKEKPRSLIYLLFIFARTGWGGCELLGSSFCISVTIVSSLGLWRRQDPPCKSSSLGGRSGILAAVAKRNAGEWQAPPLTPLLLLLGFPQGFVSSQCLVRVNTPSPFQFGTAGQFLVCLTNPSLISR